jgi:hypothetical protein
MDNPEKLSTLAHKKQDRKLRRWVSDPRENRGLSQVHTKDKQFLLLIRHCHVIPEFQF